MHANEFSNRLYKVMLVAKNIWRTAKSLAACKVESVAPLS